MRKSFLSRFAAFAVCALIFQVAVSFFQLSNVHAADITPPEPNIIIIMADDMGWGDLCKNSIEAGYPGPGCSASTSNTPNLDTLASNGVRLTNFYTPAPICSPARASLLTGKYPIHHGVINEGALLNSSAETISKVLQKLQGAYSTGIVGKWHLGGFPSTGLLKDVNTISYPNAYGFDYYYVLPYGVYYDMIGFHLAESNSVSPIPFYCTHPEVSTSQTGSCADAVPNGSTYIDFWCTDKPCDSQAKSVLYDGARKKSLTEIITYKAIEYVKNTESKYRSAGSPFFLYVALPSPHSPLDVHLPNNDGYLLKNISYNSSSCSGLSGTARKECCSGLSGGECCSDLSGTPRGECAYKIQFEENSSQYYARVIKEIDAQINEVLKNIPNNTIVIFTSDNGTDMGIHAELEGVAKYVQNSTGGLRGGKRFIFEGGVRVPFIAYWKGVDGTNQWRTISSDQLADITDLFPTLLTVATNGNPPPPSDGQDLIAFFKNGTPTANEVQYYSTKSDLAGKSSLYYQSASYFPPAYAIRKYSPENLDGLNNFKVLHSKVDGPKELYNLTSDSLERYNIAADYVPVITDRGDPGYTYNLTKFRYFLPAIKDNDIIGWENWISVKAKDAVPMDVTFRVYNLAGTLKKTYIYSDTSGADAPAVAPNATAALRPSSFADLVTSQTFNNGEGSVIIETNVAAIVSTNTIANNYNGFSINESVTPRSRHNFSKIWDGLAPMHEHKMLIQNIYNEMRYITVELFSKSGSKIKTYHDSIPAFGTKIIRPYEIYGNSAVDGSAIVYSNLNANGDGLGLGKPIPAMDRVSAGSYGLAIYDSNVAQQIHYYSALKDGKFSGTIDYQNNLTLVNTSEKLACNYLIIFYNNAGVEVARRVSDPNSSDYLFQPIEPKGKKTWRPSWIVGTYSVPSDFEGSAVIITSVPTISMTNTTHFATNAYNLAVLDLIESALPNSTLFFPKVFDNLPGSGQGATHLFDNYISIQNPDNSQKKISIQQFNAENGNSNGVATVYLAPHATHVYRPKDLVTDSSGGFRGSVIVKVDTIETPGTVTGMMKYEFHETTASSSSIQGMTLYRSMGQ